MGDVSIFTDQNEGQVLLQYYRKQKISCDLYTKGQVGIILTFHGNVYNDEWFVGLIGPRASTSK